MSAGGGVESREWRVESGEKAHGCIPGLLSILHFSTDERRRLPSRPGTERHCPAFREMLYVSPTMCWKERFLDLAGTGALTGITFGDWLKLLFENRFRVAPRFWGRACGVTACSLLNSGLRLVEEAVYGRSIAQTPVEPPLFILGHWRSGTTHLHNLLALDQRFAYPNLFDVLNPHTLLVAEPLLSRLMRLVIPSTRLGIDSMPLDLALPNEEEYALCGATVLSPYLGWVFPRGDERYEQYLTFREAPPQDLARWKAAVLQFFKKLSFKYKRPLILKSPPNTGRIGLLLDLFPEARFVHIHRHPYDVFRSTQRLNRQTWKYFNLHRPDEELLDTRILRQYSLMYDAFFDERSQIPADRYCEVTYAELEADPLGQVEAIYEQLHLADFGAARPALVEYLRSQADYRKNEHADLPHSTRLRIAQSWQRTFHEWNYAA